MSGRKLCGVSLWRGTLWRGSQDQRETGLGEAGTERQGGALRSLAQICVGFGERCQSPRGRDEAAAARPATQIKPPSAASAAVPEQEPGGVRA